MNDPDRDLFVMSKGHSVEAYYAVLAKKGFLDIKEVNEKFSKFGHSISDIRTTSFRESR